MKLLIGLKTNSPCQYHGKYIEYRTERMKKRRDGANARALASHHCSLGSICGPGVTWVEFVVGSRPCS